MTERVKPQLVVKEDRIEKLKELFPEAFGDGELNFDTLREALGDFIEDDSQEHFGLTWPGKREARKMAFLPPKGTLKLAKGEGVNEETTENLFIEGDNLEVLKLLQKSYFGKIKMIYIDPPYNTGNDFVYKDDFADTIEDYMQKTGQLDEEGKSLSTNPKTSGRFHSNWLNMMYPRLMLAKNLLREDGVIFVSIDDTEVYNLKELMNEIYGENNFIENLVWKRRATPPNDRIIGKNHEYILVYAKEFDSISLFLQPRDEKLNSRYSNPDDDPRGSWVASDLSANGKGGRLAESCVFPIKNPNDGKEYLPPQNKCWLYNKDKMAILLQEKRIGFRESTGSPYLKRYLSEVRQGQTLATILDNHGFSHESAKEIRDIFNHDVFDFPKPSRLLKTLITTGSNDTDIILDFFTGSASTAHAIMDLNKDDGNCRKFILVQLPESVNQNSEAKKVKLDYITEIGKERIRRVIKKLNEEDNNEHNQDRGFKVLKLSESNIIKWDISKTTNLDDLDKQLEIFTDPLHEGWQEEDLLIEVMIWEGFSLTSQIEKKKAGQNTFLVVTDKTMEYKLYCCFDKKLEFTLKEFSDIGFTKDDIVIFLDSSLSDKVKSRLSDLCRLKVV
jgi:adenine-specific DNA-methyltransferase